MQQFEKNKNEHKQLAENINDKSKAKKNSKCSNNKVLKLVENVVDSVFSFYANLAGTSIKM